MSLSPQHENQNEENDESIICVSSSSSFLTFVTEEHAPVEFQVVSDSDEEEIYDQDFNNSKCLTTDFDVKVSCPLCARRRQRITCKECLLQGNFCFQNSSGRRNNLPVTAQRYSELKLKVLKLQQRVHQLTAQAATYIGPKERIAAIIDEIEKSENKIAIQNELKKSLETKISNVNREKDILRHHCQERMKLFPTFRGRLNNMQSQYGQNVGNLQTFHSKVQKRQDALKKGTKKRIAHISQNVFPIEEVDVQNRNVEFQSDLLNSSWDDEEDETVRSLMAARSNYWSRPDELVSTFGTCHTITGPYGPTLPATGDYSAYHIWADSNPGRVTGTTSRNSAHNITAALTYTTQFVNQIAYYLDLRLPHRLSYSEFTTGDLTSGNFNRKVAKLNANVIYLCSSQGIPSSFLHPKKTLPNLLLLFDPTHSDLGRRGPFEVSPQLAKSIEDSIEKDLVICGDASSESNPNWSSSESNVLPSDWHTINQSIVCCNEFGCRALMDNSVSVTPLYSNDSNYRSRNQASMTGTGLLSSVTSFFRGWNS